ncbi:MULTISPECIES: hypothetical protein [Pseudomonas]|nr:MULTISPECIES: hypothetical protein [Pseudomonas]
MQRIQMLKGRVCELLTDACVDQPARLPDFTSRWCKPLNSPP